jgi:hypothetical protein
MGTARGTYVSNSQYIIEPNQLKPNSSGNIPLSFELMEKNILYFSLNPNYPLSDTMHKRKDANGVVDELCLIQVSREKSSRTINETASIQIKEKLNITDFSKCSLFLFWISN